ncbi:MAG TPA: hypothetical protein VKZ56_01535 [Membranihabitans sp.]|nr:hypothetical protein [Membranihabitans sp.]
MKIKTTIFWIVILLTGVRLHSQSIMTVTGEQKIANIMTWLTHEHVLVDFIGAELITPDDYDETEVLQTMLSYVFDLRKYRVRYFVDATPKYLGRDPELLQKISTSTAVTIITNTGLYGVGQNKYIPKSALNKTAEELAGEWIDEYRNGIGDTGIKPGFIKIGVDAQAPLHSMHQKLVRAAALTHLATGLTIASHTGEAVGLWPQLEILKKEGVSPSAFIWVHAQNEKDNNVYVQAARQGCWISLDGIGGGNIDTYVEKLQFAKDKGILGQILISNDAGWYDPQKDEQNIQPFTNVHEKLLPKLTEAGFTVDEINQLLATNPAKAFGTRVRKR